MSKEFIWTDELVKEFAVRYKMNIQNVGHLPYFVENNWIEDFKKEKCKKLLYKTEDNWFVYEYDTYPTYKVDKKLQILQFAACDTNGDDKSAKYFHNKEKAEQYVSMNKPYFSGQEIINLCEQIQFHNRIHDRADEDYYAVYVSLLVTRLLELSKLKTGSADR